MKMTPEATKTVMALVALVITSMAIAALFVVRIPEANRDMVNIVLGAIIGWGTTVFSYYFGDSAKRSGGQNE